MHIFLGTGISYLTNYQHVFCEHVHKQFTYVSAAKARSSSELKKKQQNMGFCKKRRTQNVRTKSVVEKWLRADIKKSGAPAFLSYDSELLKQRPFNVIKIAIAAHKFESLAIYLSEK